MIPSCSEPGRSEALSLCLYAFYSHILTTVGLSLIVTVQCSVLVLQDTQSHPPSIDLVINTKKISWLQQGLCVSLLRPKPPTRRQGQFKLSLSVCKWSEERLQSLTYSIHWSTETQTTTTYKHKMQSRILTAAIALASVGLALPTKGDNLIPTRTLDKRDVAATIAAIMPSSTSCSGRGDECTTAEDAVEYLTGSMAEYHVTTSIEQAGILALIAYESGEMQYKKNLDQAAQPGRGTANMSVFFPFLTFRLCMLLTSLFSLLGNLAPSTSSSRQLWVWAATQPPRYST